jgi:hypothetical protein
MRKIFFSTRKSLARIALLTLQGKSKDEIQKHMEGRCGTSPSLEHIFGTHFKHAKTKEDFRKVIDNFKTLSEQNKGKNNPWFGKHHSEEQKKEWKKTRKGKNTGEKNSMFGKHHTDAARDKIRQARIGSWSGENNPNYNGTSKTAETKFVKILGHKIRSGWEEDICMALQESGIDYEYEKEFDLDTKKFIVDIYLKDTERYVEIKGRVDEDDIEKMRLFKQKYPENKLIVITKRSTIQEARIPQDCYDEIYDIVTVTIPQICGKNEEADEEIPF